MKGANENYTYNSRLQFPFVENKRSHGKPVLLIGNIVSNSILLTIHNINNYWVVTCRKTMGRNKLVC